MHQRPHFRIHFMKTPPDQLENCDPIGIVLLIVDEWANEGVQNVRQSDPFFSCGLFQGIQPRNPLLIDRTHPPQEHLHHQPILGSKMVIDRPEIRLGRLCNVANRSSRNALLSQQFLGGIQQRLARSCGRRAWRGSQLIHTIV